MHKNLFPCHVTEEEAQIHYTIIKIFLWQRGAKVELLQETQTTHKKEQNRDKKDQSQSCTALPGPAEAGQGWGSAAKHLPEALGAAIACQDLTGGIRLVSRSTSPFSALPPLNLNFENFPNKVQVTEHSGFQRLYRNP